MNRMFSVNEISRKFDFPYSTLIAKVREGKLVPDAIAGRSFLFLSSRLGEIEQFLKEVRTQNATF
jgi:hypothetical protein